MPDRYERRGGRRFARRGGPVSYTHLNGAIPEFGPAPRPLPQLPLYIDAEGNIRAQNGYDQPVGPGFWERHNV